MNIEENEDTTTTESILPHQDNEEIDGKIPDTDSSDAQGDGKDTAAEGDAARDESSAEARAAGAPPAYTPNFKFKVKDKELEFEDWAKTAARTPEDEKKIRELHQKAYGLDDIKNDRQAAKTQLQEVTTKHQQLEKAVTSLGTLASQGKFGDFFNALGIPKERIVQYAIDELKYAQLPDEEKAKIEAQRAREQQFEELQYQTEAQQQQLQHFVRDAKIQELNMTMSAPDVARIAQEYDSRLGKPGAFQTEVIKRGQYYEAVNGQTIPARQAADELIAILGGHGMQSASSTSSPESQGNAVAAASVQPPKPVIPSFSGQAGKSPAKKVYTKIEDLRKLRQQMNAQN